MTLTATHIIGILLTVGLLLAVSILSGRKVKDAHSFATGGKAGSWMVCGAILGTLVGGQSTIGTAQLAFSFGLSAWWFTIGAALLLPLSFALWLPGRFTAQAVIASMIAGTAAMLAAGLLHLPADPMYYGLAASALVLLPSWRNNRKQ